MATAKPQGDSCYQRLSTKYMWRKLALCVDDFTTDDVSRLESRLHQFENKRGKSDPVYLHLGTSGGSLMGMTHFIDVIHSTNIPVYGLAVDKCYDAGFCILQACDQRLALPNATFALQSNSTDMKFRLHPYVDLETVKKSVDDEYATLISKRDEIIDMLQKRLTNYSREALLEMMRLGKVINAEEALRLGLIDEIVSII